MFVFLVLSFAALVSACVLVWARGVRARSMLAALPSLPALPLIGNLHQFYGDSQFIFKKMSEMSDTMEKTQLPFVFWLGPNPVILVHEANDVKAVTNAFVSKPYLYSFAKVWLGDGLVTADDAIWKRNIKKLAGTFTSGVVDGYQDVFNAQAQRLVDQLRTKAGDEPFNCMHYLAYTTLEAICQTALGVARITESVVTEDYYTAFNRTLELMVRRGLNLLYHPDWVYRLTPSYREMMRNVAALHNVSDQVMMKRKKEREENKKKSINNNAGNIADGTSSRFKAFLDILLELRDVDPSLSEQQIKSEVDTIIVGGQETVATTLFYTLLMIGSHPDVQDTLYAELAEIFGGSARAVRRGDLARMRYCEAVLLETLRLFPPVPVVMRRAHRDLALDSCTVPAGTFVGVSAWGAGRSRRAWGADAAEFRPARWAPGGAAGAAGAAFLAFSYGRRACIGKKYAMAILKTTLAYCVRALRFRSDVTQLRLAFDIALRPAAGQLIQVYTRE